MEQTGVKVLRYNDLTARGYGSRTTIWRNVKDGKLPPPRQIGHRPGWLEHEVDQTAQQAPIYHPK